MNQIFSKFNLYDQIGYLLVGSVALLVIYGNSVLMSIKVPDFNLTNFSLWLIVSYFAGHLTQAIANMVIKEKKDNFTEKEQEVLKSARAFFKQETLSDNETWNLCYMLATAKDLTGHIQAFNAYYSLYRGWFVVFAMESLFIAIYTLFAFSFFKLSLTFLCITIALLYYSRLRRFHSYLRSKVLQTFVLISTLETR